MRLGAIGGRLIGDSRRSVGAITKGFGFRLRTTRQQRGLSQKDPADLISTTVMQISRYERGQILPAFETAVALVDVLHVSADALLMGRDSGPATIGPRGHHPAHRWRHRPTRHRGSASAPSAGVSPRLADHG